MEHGPLYVRVHGFTGSCEMSTAPPPQQAHARQAPPYPGEERASGHWRAQQSHQRQPPQRMDDAKPEENARFRAQFLKSRLCRYHKTGCLRGDRCPFAHGLEELQGAPDLTKTSLCKAFVAGACPHRAEDCSFAHGHDDLRVTRAYLKSAPCTLFIKGLCKLGNNCRHAHTVAEIRDTKEAVARRRGLGRMYCVADGAQDHVEKPLPSAQPPGRAGHGEGPVSLAGMLRSFPPPPLGASAAAPDLEKSAGAAGGFLDSSSTAGSSGDSQEARDHHSDFDEGAWEESRAADEGSPLGQAPPASPPPAGSVVAEWRHKLRAANAKWRQERAMTPAALPEE